MRAYALPVEQRADTTSCVKPVGEGRINLVVIRDRVICIRKGSVLLPSIGVVISLEEKTGMQLICENGLCLNADGGGSAMLGMSIGNSFMELSYPSTSLDNCAGMVRTVNTALCIGIT